MHPSDPKSVAITSKEVRSIAHLARLGVNEATLDELAHDLSTVLELVEQMSSVDTAGVEPMAHPGTAELRLRADEVSEHDEREALQAPAPAAQDGFFLVPRVIE